MKRFLRYITWLAGVVVFLLITAHFTLRYTLNTPKFKEALTGFIERTTGRAIEYERIDYALFPFSLVVRKAELKEADGTTDFASIEEFAVLVDFRRKEIIALRLVEPTVRIVQYADGTFNFSDLMPKEPEKVPAGPAKPTEAAQPSGATPAPAPPKAVAAEPYSIKRVQLDRATLEFVRVGENQEETPFLLSDLNIQLKDFSPDQPFQMNGTVNIGKTSTLAFSLSGPAPAAYAERPGEWPIQWTSRVDIRDFADLKAFLPDQALPFQSLRMNVALSGNLMDGLKLDADLKTPDATDKHPVAMDLTLQADLALPGSVIQHVLAGQPLPESIPSGATPCTAPAGTITLTTLPLESLLIRQAKAHATLRFASIAYGLNRLENGVVTAQLDNGALTFSSIQMSAYAGTIAARGSVALLACPLSYRLDHLSATQLEIAQVVAANGIEAVESFSGILQLEASAAGTAVAAEGLPSLEADATVRIDNLQSVGTDGSLMDQIWLKLDNPLLLKLVPHMREKVEEASRSASTVSTSRYDLATATLALRDGVATLSNTCLSATHYRLDLTGTVRPFDDRLDLIAQLRFSREETSRLTGGKDLSAYLPYERGGLRIPVAITGSMTKPTVLPDLDQLLRNALTGPVTEQLGSHLRQPLRLRQEACSGRPATAAGTCSSSAKKRLLAPPHFPV